MTQPAIYNIKAQRQADFSLQLRFLDSNRSAINLTGWQVLSQIWNAEKTIKHADFTIAYTNRTQGIVRLSLSSTTTTSLPSQSVYDVLLIDANGTQEYYLEGGVSIEPSYTTP